MKRIALFAFAILVLLLLISFCFGSSKKTPLPENEVMNIPHAAEFPAPEHVNTSNMVLVPEGWFVRGRISGKGSSDERPSRKIFLDAFYMDKTEVTVAEYKKCIDAEVCIDENLDQIKYLKHGPMKSEYCNIGRQGYENHPINCLSWEEASAYCQFLNKRLPTETEWEKSARGTDHRNYPWGDEQPGTGSVKRGNFCDISAKKSFPNVEIVAPDYDDGYVTTSPVGSFPKGASPYGILDLAGNVWEWVLDGYNDKAYSFSLEKNPYFGSAMGIRVYRGGAFESYASWLRIPKRAGLHQTDRAYWVGFRCAVSAPKGSLPNSVDSKSPPKSDKNIHP
jgi:eukaryotic-like serine/threonine-protein kinase